jgi:hypothetical protein
MGCHAGEFRTATRLEQDAVSKWSFSVGTMAPAGSGEHVFCFALRKIFGKEAAEAIVCCIYFYFYLS